MKLSIKCTQFFHHHFVRYHGHISAALVLGGVDVTGPSLYMIHPHGSTAKLPFVTMGTSFQCILSTLLNTFFGLHMMPNAYDA